MQRTPSDFDEAMRQALASEREERWEEACRHYGAAMSIAPMRPLPYLCLGCALGKLERYDEAAQVLSLGHERDGRLLSLWKSAATERDVSVRSRFADALLRRFMTDLHRHSVLAVEHESGCEPLHRIRSAIWCQTHDRPFEYKHPLLRPWLLYLPDLEPVPWFHADDLAWIDSLNRRTVLLQEEILAAVDCLHDVARPYISADTPLTEDLAEVHGSTRWSSIHLFQAGVSAEERILRTFPETLSMFEEVDCVRLHGNPMEAVVSILAPGTQIPPHYGLANTRLTVHLPVRVPSGCSLTVAGERREVREGQVLAFDDGFLHQAENPSGEVRIHLLFEAWRPDLEPLEKAALTRSMEDRKRWNLNRRIPACAGAAVQ